MDYRLLSASSEHRCGVEGLGAGGDGYSSSSFHANRHDHSLHDHAPAASLLVVATVFYAHLGYAVLLAARGRALVRRHLLVVSADFPDDIVEGVVNVDPGLSRGLDEFATELPCKILALYMSRYYGPGGM